MPSARLQMSSTKVSSGCQLRATMHDCTLSNVYAIKWSWLSTHVHCRAKLTDAPHPLHRTLIRLDDRQW
jgi:hypothetical protein